MEGFGKALDDWRTSKRMFMEADGKFPDAETMRLAFVAMLPHEVYTYVSLHLDMEEYDSVGKLEKFVLKYAKLLRHGASLEWHILLSMSPGRRPPSRLTSHEEAKS